MKLSDLLASFGVIILLIAFVMNLSKRWSAENRFYILLNFIGAAVCCCASYLIRFYPFVILESIWAAVALYSLIKVPRGT